MDEEVLNDLYDRAVSKGYPKSIEEFSLLLSSDDEVLNDNFNYVTQQGYSKSIEEFSELIGVKKKEELVQEDTVSVSEDGGLVSPTIAEVDTTVIGQVPQEFGGDEVEQYTPEKVEEGRDTRLAGYVDPLSIQLLGMYPDDEKLRIAQEEHDRDVAYTESIEKELEFGGNLLTEGANQFERSVSNLSEFQRKPHDTPKPIGDYGEEFVVPKMNYEFGQYGFEFEDTGVGDAMIVTASNDETLRVNLDTFLEIGDTENTAELQEFLRKNKDTTLTQLAEDEVRVLNEEEIVSTVRTYNTETETFREEQNAFVKEYTEFVAELTELEDLGTDAVNADPELLAQYREKLARKKEYQDEYTELRERSKGFAAQGARLDKLAAEYAEMQSEQGTFWEGIWNRLAKYPSTIASSTTRALLGAGIELLPTEGLVGVDNYAERLGLEVPEGMSDEEGIEWLKKQEEVVTTTPMEVGVDGVIGGRTTRSYPKYEAIINESQDRSLKEFFYGEKQYRNPYSAVAATTDTDIGFIDAIKLGKDIFQSDNTTEQWDKLHSQNFWEGALLGVAESLPAMVGGAGIAGMAQRTAQMYALSTEHVYDEMQQDAAFDDISETEKFMVTAPIGIAVGILETIGFRNLTSSNPLVLNLVSRALKKTGKGTTAKTFGELIRKDVDGWMSRGLLVLTAAGAAEFETGLAQEIAEVGVKDIYNEIKGKDMFQTPDTWTQYVGQVLRAGAQEAVGGFVLGAPSAVAAAAKKGELTSVDDTSWAIFKGLLTDPEYKTQYVTKLKQQVAAGEISSKEQQEKLALVNQLLGVMPQIPTDFNEAQQRQALELLFKKQELESEIEGKDDSLVKRQKKKIADITVQLEALAEQAAIEQQQDKAAEADIAEEGVSSKTQEEVTEDVTEEEQGDVEEFFGETVEETTEQVNDNLSINKKGSYKFSPTQKSIRNRVVKAARMGAKAVSKVLPDVRIVLHESNDEYLKFDKEGQPGTFVDNAIHINLSKANVRTVPHEIFHAVFINKVKTDAAAAKAAEKMMLSVRKTLEDGSALAKRIDSFAAQYTEGLEEFQNEERLAELVGILSSEYKNLNKPAKNKVIQFLKNFAKRFGIDLDSDFGKTDESVIDLLNTISRKVRKGEVIEEADISLLEQIPYSEGEVVTPVEGDMKPQGRKQKNIFEGIDFVESLPVVSLREFIDSVKGKIFAVTSDATKVGYDNNGERVDGGFGYSAFKENLAGNIGFASLNMEVAKKTLAKIAKNFTSGDVIGIMIMVQNPSATIGNYYGGKYLGRGLKQLQEADGAAYQLMIDEVTKLLQTNKKIRNALKQKQTEQKLIDLLRDPSKLTENEFAKEWISDTTFEVRREMLKAMIINSPDTRTNKSTPIYKTMLKDAGFSLQDFLMEYGDVRLIGENNLKEDNGGFLVGGFKMTVPKSGEVNTLIAEVETKGFTHPQFNGKLPSTGEHFLFDGLYPIQENLQEFAVGETRIGEEMQEDADARVRKLAKKKGLGVFERRFVDKGSDNYVPIKKRGYRHLTSQAKIIFKNQNEELLVESTPLLAANVARGMGLKTKEAVPAGVDYTTAPRQQKLDEGRTEVDGMKSGKKTIVNPFKIFKGLGGKVDLYGMRINAHEGAEGMFTSIDRDLADQYAGDVGVVEAVVPEGATVEVVEVTGKKVSEYRQAEVDAINNSEADVVKLITLDGRLRAGERKQSQYIIKNADLLTELGAAKPAPRQQKSMNDIIQEGREANFRDAVLRDYLIRVRKFQARVVDAALEVSRDMFEKLPNSFKDMIGGIKAGEKLYKKVEDYRKKLERRNARSKYRTEAEIKAMVKAYAKELRGSYDTIAEMQEKLDKYRALIKKNRRAWKQRGPLTDAEIATMVAKERGRLMEQRDAKREAANAKVAQFEVKEIRKNNKRVKILSEQEIMDALIEYMQAQPEYKNEGDSYVEKGKKKFRKGISTQQARMVIDLQKGVGIRPTQDMSAKIRRARIAVAERMKGQRDVQAVKRALRNFMRVSLPADLYTKKEVLDLLYKIEIATEDKLDNLMGEVTEFVISKNVEALRRSIKNILEGKYTDIVSGRKKGVKIDLATMEQLESIKKRVLKKGTAKEVTDANAKLQEQWNELDKKPDATVEEQMEMVALQIIIELNNSLVMEDTDSNKVSTLDAVNTTLVEMVEFGKTVLQQELAESKEEYERQFKIAYEEITGRFIKDENLKQALEEELQYRGTEKSRQEVKARIKRFAKFIANYTNIVFRSAEALDGLMDAISKMPGELFGGRLQEEITAKVDASTRTFKQRKMYVEAKVQAKLEELYGKGWRKIAREHRKKKTPIALNEEAIRAAEQAYEDNPSKENKEALNDALNKHERMYSQNQMYYLYNQYKDPSNHGAFEKMFGKNHADIMAKIEEALDPNVKAFADWQVNEFFPELYDYYNDIYKRIYRTNMPWNVHYAGRIYRDGVTVEPLDLLSGNNAFNNSVNGASTRARLENNLRIREMDGTDALMSYLNDMEYFGAYSETIRDVNKIFTNEYIKDAIESIHGKPTMRLITNMIEKIANKGTRTEMMAGFINSMNTAFIVSRLGLSPVILIKQLTSTFTFANDIGFRNWTKYSAKSIPQLKDTWREIRENSVYMQDRKYDGIMKAIESYSDEAMKKFVPSPTKDFFVNVAMYMVKFGDRSAIYLGGTPNYLFYKDQALKEGKTEQEAIDIAIRKFERDTKRTQQSADLQDKDIFQTSNPVIRAMNMFLSTPKQYLRKEIQAVRSLNRKLLAWDKNAGKGTVKENVRTLLMYHVFMPVLFQYVAMGLPGMLRGWRDDDEDDLIRAAVIGNLNALFILGEAVTFLGDYFTGKPWAGESAKTVGMLNVIGGIVQRFKRADETKDPEKKAEQMKKAYAELITLTGIPAPTLAKLADNYDKIISGEADDTGELILRLLNFSEYQILGPKKDDKKVKTIQEINEAYDRQLRKEEQEMKRQQKLLEDRGRERTRGRSRSNGRGRSRRR